MNPRRPITASADRAAEMPAGLAERLDRIARARASLDEEARRLERLGFEIPLHRCHEERRYWSFLAAVHEMAVPAERVLTDPARAIAMPSRWA